ncbi:bifunctional diaminohydroxyphosphoribosylaminopyrimidine deaminase/5-amino-6-(5-phosphoribosylamino)uracil reductase RibD [Allochromatium palmeri]|uniref:Riboflavin biosynthesis protein RibD n=1 Tax=Allochromatium palmeri TaxID=231048 RepID=A0A6N8ED90_9GAMM|nr:bifunctional diaminohydroxyphosphoribosylaminopyrimidine deaminase/5-amino-6-(5-phosphoribosylamino)uracil reductase RibD [Allochromatium palmeri]MTW20879.1 bifunctional diaminohydroxyphosphoribosylaminopyrimidine deaminase/5-amino-6-(5-phosphoribosylamino)uracil reductase RibD [Allochromatium palmeri]
MARAIQLAALGRYTTDPNPRVGCVLVRDGQVVGEGWHRRAGEPHAEPLALAAAGERARGATVYVTLEPCAHQGRTPPCAEALIAAGVARVLCAMVDPNPRVAGRGIERLRQAGIAVEVGCLESEARTLNPGFIKRHEQGRPYVRCKLAASLDGRTALATGESQWITAEAARHDVQRWRAASSAIVTGLGTVLGDDPSLNVRLTAAELPGLDPDDPVRQPWRIVVDSYWRTPPQARLLSLPGRTLIAGIGPKNAAAAALEAAGAELIQLPERAGRVDLVAFMAELARREVNEVLLEAGSTLSGAVVHAGLVDEILLYQAPCLMGQAAKGLFDLPGIDTMADRVALEILDVRRIGRDLRIRARPDL